MDLINGIIGFAVLSGPLWLIVIILPISIFIAYIISKQFRSSSSRIIVGILAFLALFFLPFSDEIAGRIYMNHLCANQAGVEVYETVELTSEYWDEEGVAKFYRNFDSLLGNKYSIEYKLGIYSPFFHIDNAGYAYLDKQTGKVLGEAIDFRYWGGWIKRNFTQNISATSCIDYADYSNRLIDLIFIPK